MRCYGDTQSMGVAVALSVAAGMSGALGCAIVFLLPPNNKLYLSAAAAFAAGVMIYIALAEVLAEDSVNGFRNAGYTDKQAYLYSTLCLFAGLPFTWALDKAMEWGLRSLQDQEAAVEGAGQSLLESEAVKHATPQSSCHSASGSDNAGEKPHADEEAAVTPTDVTPIFTGQEKTQMAHTGYLAVLVMCLHNLPEGLAMFVGWMAGTGPGLVLALAFILHNIPEGMIVAMPIYYASGSKLKGFLWGSLSTMCLPLGSLIGVAISCTGQLTDLSIGIVFGMVAGLLVYLSLLEFYPLAIKFDPENKVRGAALIAGIVVIASSIVVIEWAAVPPPPGVIS